MRVVGIDTATSTASVALVEDGRLISERTHPVDASAGNTNRLRSRGNHAENILPLIEALFASSDISLGDVHGVALSIGPGSFTGLRIGLSTVKGLAYGWRLPVVGVSTLLAHAARIIDYDGLICALLDARKSEVYVALFEKTGGTVKRLTQDSVSSIADVVTLVSRSQFVAPCLFVGDGADVHTRLLLELPGARVLSGATQLSCPTVAATVAHLSEKQFRFKEVEDLGSLTPVYIRPPEAEFKRRSLV